MDMLYGALGAFFFFAVLLLGALLGWKLRGRLSSVQTVEAPDAEEMRRMKEEQAAFLRMQNYNAETAYGLNASLEDELSGGETA